MASVILFLGMAVLVGVGIALFFWKQISSERNVGNNCPICEKPLTGSKLRGCNHCKAVMCSECTTGPACPRCGMAWG